MTDETDSRPPCTASIRTAFSGETFRCVRSVDGHGADVDDPHQAPTAEGDAHCWVDRADGAVPHRAEPDPGTAEPPPLAIPEAAARQVRDALNTALGDDGREAVAALAPALGTEALFFFRMDAAEDVRRRAVSAGRLDKLPPLETLLTLPVGLPVPLASLDQRERRDVRALPAGAADRDRRAVTRWAVRPLQIDLAIVRSSGWRQGLERAGRFAPFCRRAMLLERRPARLEESLAEADFYGIGVFVPLGDGVEMVLEPRAYRPQRHTAAAWAFVEELYQRVRSRVVETEAERDQLSVDVDARDETIRHLDAGLAADRAALDRVRADCQLYADQFSAAERARQLAEAEAVRLRRELETMTAVARGDKRHVQLIAPDLIKASAALARVRALADGLTAEPHPTHDHLCPDGVARQILAALDGEAPEPDEPAAGDA